MTTSLALSSNERGPLMFFFVLRANLIATFAAPGGTVTVPPPLPDHARRILVVFVINEVAGVEQIAISLNKQLFVVNMFI